MRIRLMCVVAALALVQGVLADRAAGWDFPRGPVSGTGADLQEKLITPMNVGSLTRIWARGKTGAYWGGVTVEAGRLFYGTGYGYRDRNPNLVVARRAATGRLLWSRKLSRPTTSTPVAHGSHVFIFAGADQLHSSGRLYALAARTGRVVWSYGLPGTGYHAPIWPIVHAGVVYMAWDDNRRTVTALDESTGELIWRVRLQQQPGLHLAVADGYLLVGNLAFAPGTGRLLGAFPLPSNGGSVPILTRHAAYEVGTGSDANYQSQIFVRKYPLSCVPGGPVPCRPSWVRTFDGTVQGEVAVTPRHILIPVESNPAAGAGGVIAVGPRRGHLQWAWTGPTGTAGRDVSVGGNVAYLTTWRYYDYRHPRLYAFDTAGCGQPNCPSLGSWATGRQGTSSAASPVIDNGIVYIWNDWQDGVWAFAPS